MISKLLCARYGSVEVRFDEGIKAKWPEDTTLVYIFGVAKMVERLSKKATEHASKTGKTLRVVSYGFKIPGKKPERESGPYILYKF